MNELVLSVVDIDSFIRDLYCVELLLTVSSVLYNETSSHGLVLDVIKFFERIWNKVFTSLVLINILHSHKREWFFVLSCFFQRVDFAIIAVRKHYLCLDVIIRDCLVLYFIFLSVFIFDTGVNSHMSGWKKIWHWRKKFRYHSFGICYKFNFRRVCRI